MNSVDLENVIGHIKKLRDECEFLSAIEVALDVMEDLDGLAFADSTEGMVKKEMQKECRKPVDLSVLIDSGIDCCFEYDNENWWQWHGESHLDPVKLLIMPRMDYWFSENNFDGHAGHLVCDLEAAGFVLEYDREDGNWTAFRITGLQDNYCWPWEIEQ